MSPDEFRQRQQDFPEEFVHSHSQSFQMTNDSDGNAILNYQSLVDGQEINLNIDVSSMNDSEIQNLIADLMDQASGDDFDEKAP